MNRRGNLKLLTASIALGLGLSGGAFAQSVAGRQRHFVERPVGKQAVAIEGRAMGRSDWRHGSTSGGRRAILPG